MPLGKYIFVPMTREEPKGIAASCIFWTAMGVVDSCRPVSCLLEAGTIAS